MFINCRLVNTVYPAAPATAKFAAVAVLVEISLYLLIISKVTAANPAVKPALSKVCASIGRLLTNPVTLDSLGDIRTPRPSE